MTALAITDIPIKVPEKGAPMPSGAWSRREKIRFSHCDPGKIVYTPVFFDLMNGTIEDWYSDALGIAYESFMLERNMGMGYVHASADFVQPAMFGNRLDIAVFVNHLGATSIDLALPFYREGREILRGRMVIVATSLDDHSKTSIPDDLRAAILTYQEGIDL